jgi:large subunit ribosomal protein L21
MRDFYSLKNILTSFQKQVVYTITLHIYFIMKYAVVDIAGHQYKVKKGDVFSTERIEGKIGDTITCDKVLLAFEEEGKNMTLGAPYLDTTKEKVTFKILEHDKDKKMIIQKFHRRKRYSKKQGHRQLYTKVEIMSVA